jgi:ADP-ribose pyrophosphatase YjhB (NUDIX family)
MQQPQRPRNRVASPVFRRPPACQPWDEAPDWRMAETSDRQAGNFERRVPEGDDRSRLVCRDCGYIQYENPRIVVGSVCHWEERILLCRRAINPRRGFWTLPAGYMELGETTAEGAKREAWEEARAKLELQGLIAVYNIPRLSQVQLIYRAALLAPNVEAGPESAEVGLFDWPSIPWEELAFPSVRWALGHYRDGAGEAGRAIESNPPGEWGNY